MEDFQKLISEVTARYKPEYDYPKLNDASLLVHFCVYAVGACQCVIRILNMKDMAPPTKETTQKVSRISADPSPENLAWLYSLHPDKRPL